MTKNFLISLILSTLAVTKSEDSLQYYNNLLENFIINASEWEEEPTNSREYFEITNDELGDWGNFDFIIAGAGVGGSVLINRLTESGKFEVLVLEAGGYENDFTDVPAFATLLAHSYFNWGYKTIPQSNACLGCRNKQCNYPRGKAIGGGSVINYMMYIRASKDDYNKWGEDNPGWDYDSVLPYFKKSEKSNLEFEDHDYHGHDGPVNVEFTKHRPSIVDILLKAVKENGATVLDYNGEKKMGFSRLQTMTKNGRRFSASKAYVKPATNRPNLQILDHSLAIKILTKEKKAYGVEFIHEGKKYQATASKEVIVSGGTINSAQLLMLSGIGPKEHLEEMNIPLVQDLPVGKEFRDHPTFMALPITTNLNEPQLSVSEHLQNYLKGYGLLTCASSVTAVGFNNARLKSDTNPNIEYMFAAAFPEQASLSYRDFMEFTEENWLALSEPLKGRYFWTMLPMMLHPKSVGTIKLQSNDPLDFPLMDANLYSDPEGEDVAEMLSAIKYVLELSKMPAFKSIDSQYNGNSYPACSHLKYPSDDYWLCLIKQFTLPMMHAVSSCKMGPENDKTAVVDNTLKVYGVDGLRVVDASVIPFSLSGHPTATIYMIGEKAADLIRKDHGDL